MSSPNGPGLSVGRFEKTLTAARRGEQSQLGILLNVYRRYLLSVASKKLSHSVVAKAATVRSRPRGIVTGLPRDSASFEGPQNVNCEPG